MDLIRRYLLQIKAQMAALTISQRLLIGLLGVVMVATIFFTVVWSAKPQMVTLLPQAMSDEEIARAEMSLKNNHYEYQVSGNKILVPVEQAYSIRGRLGAEQWLPKNMESAFAEFVRNQNPFSTEAHNSRAWDNALQTEVSRHIQNFPYLQDASVIISMGQQSGIGRAAVPHTAVVYASTKGNEELSQGQIIAIVEGVTGGVAGMKRENVSVIVNGQRAYHAPSGDAPISADLISFKKNLEDYFTQQLFKIFSTYGDVKIAVNVMPDLSTRQTEDLKLDPKNSVVKPLSETVHESSSHDSGSGAGGEPGTKTNVEAIAGDNAAPAAAKGSGQTSSESKTENKVEVGHSLEHKSTPAGVEYKELSATLMLPRSYFVSLYKRQNPDAKDVPDDSKFDAKLQPLIDPMLKSAVALAKNAIGAKTDDQIEVSLYDDTIVPRMPDVVMASSGLMAMGANGGLVPMIAQYAKQGVLAVVALGALVMMLRMVKRAVPAGGAEDEIDTGAFFGFGGAGKKKKSNVEQLDAADDVFGEANQGEAVLTGIELDDETLASRKMVDEVSSMIKENPENAAALVKRWMTKSK